MKSGVRIFLFVLLMLNSGCPEKEIKVKLDDGRKEASSLDKPSEEKPDSLRIEDIEEPSSDDLDIKEIEEILKFQLAYIHDSEKLIYSAKDEINRKNEEKMVAFLQMDPIQEEGELTLAVVHKTAPTYIIKLLGTVDRDQGAMSLHLKALHEKAYTTDILKRQHHVTQIDESFPFINTKTLRHPHEYLQKVFGPGSGFSFPTKSHIPIKQLLEENAQFPGIDNYVYTFLPSNHKAFEVIEPDETIQPFNIAFYFYPNETPWNQAVRVFRSSSNFLNWNPLDDHYYVEPVLLWQIVENQLYLVISTAKAKEFIQNKMISLKSPFEKIRSLPNTEFLRLRLQFAQDEQILEEKFYEDDDEVRIPLQTHRGILSVLVEFVNTYGEVIHTLVTRPSVYREGAQ